MNASGYVLTILSCSTNVQIEAPSTTRAKMILLRFFILIYVLLIILVFVYLWSEKRDFLAELIEEEPDDADRRVVVGILA